MPNGVSPVPYPKQPKPQQELELNDSYFLVRLHDSQAFYKAGWLSEPGFITFSSSVESSFQPDSATQSLHKISSVQKNEPCRLGLSINLTDWLPARPTDWLRINLKYTVWQDKPLQNLMAQLEQSGLVAQVSLLKPDWAVALKVSKIVGQLVSYLLREGKSEDIFSSTIDLNLQNLRAGYQVVVGSNSGEVLPTSLEIDASGNLRNIGLGSLSHLSYAVIEVLVLKRRGREIARDEPWWELLEAVKEQILDAELSSDLERRKLVGDWVSTLSRVRVLARKQRGFLLPEIDEIIAEAQVAVDNKLAPQTTNESFGIDDELPPDLQDLLGVRSDRELRHLVKNYQEALRVSQELLKHYNF